MSTYDTYVPGQPNSHNEETCSACIDRAHDDLRRNASAPESTPFAIPAADSEIEDVFVSQGLGLDDSMDYDDGASDGDESDTEEVIHKSCSGIQDLLLTGEVCVGSCEEVAFC